MLFLVGSLDSPPAPSALLKALRLPFEAILTGAGLMVGTKSAPLIAWPTPVSNMSLELAPSIW